MPIEDEAFLRAYLNRIAYDGDTSPTLDNLYALQVQHIYAVPFENLDIMNGIPVTLDKDFLFQRIVTEHRGGVCYELNRSFYHLLRALNYDTTFISGMVILGGSLVEHGLNLVRLDGVDYAVDVGFGDCVLPPLPLRHGVKQNAYGWTYSVAQQGELYHLLRQRPGGLPMRMYSFMTTPRTIEDLMPRFRVAAKPGGSPFGSYYVCTWQRPNGRLSMVRETLTVVEDGKTTKLAIENEAQRAQYLREYFDLP